MSSKWLAMHREGKLIQKKSRDVTPGEQTLPFPERRTAYLYLTVSTNSAGGSIEDQILANHTDNKGKKSQDLQFL